MLTAGKEQLEERLSQLRAQYEEYRNKGLKLDMSRGKPSKEQLDLSQGLLTVLSENEQALCDGTDARNYGMMEGLPSCRRLFGELLGVPWENVVAGGNSSLTMMFDMVMAFWVFGDATVGKPWGKEPAIKFLCPVPGYDRHFTICEKLGIEMIPVPMDESGPDMDLVEKLAGEDMRIKGIWCVPKYSNPTGAVYTPETVKRLASMKAAPDFKIFWDNAYMVHPLGSRDIPLPDLFGTCKSLGTEDRVLIFCSTSKISYPGSGVAAMALSDKNMAWLRKWMCAQMIGPDKVNQLRHVLYFKNADGIRHQMQRQAELLAPKFQIVLHMLEERLGGSGVAKWSRPVGGYFISFDALPGCAGRIYTLCKEAGVVLTGPGATFPHGCDPKDSNLRIAPSYPPIEELRQAMEVFCTCVEIASAEKLLAMKS